MKKAKKRAKPVSRVELSIVKGDEGGSPYYDVREWVYCLGRGARNFCSVCPHKHKIKAGAERCAKRTKKAMGNVVIVPYKGKR